jgi:hypothetical protein
MLITSPIAQITVCAPNHIQKMKKIGKNSHFKYLIKGKYIVGVN